MVGLHLRAFYCDQPGRNDSSFISPLFANDQNIPHARDISRRRGLKENNVIGKCSIVTQLTLVCSDLETLEPTWRWGCSICQD